MHVHISRRIYAKLRIKPWQLSPPLEPLCDSSARRYNMKAALMFCVSYTRVRLQIFFVFRPKNNDDNNLILVATMSPNA